MTDNHWLRKAEYASILAAVAGTVAAEATRQVVFASAPLSMALLLNLVNRRRADQINNQKVDSEVGWLRHDFYELDRKVWQDVESIRQQMLSLPTAPEQFNPREVKAAIEAEVLNHLQAIEFPDLEPLHQEVFALHTEVAQLQSHVQETTSQVYPDLNLLQEQIDHLHQQFMSSTQALDTAHVEQQFEELKAAIAGLEEKTEPLLAGERISQTFDPAPLEERYEELKAAIVGLEQQSEKSLAERDLSILFSEIRTIHQRQDVLEEQIIKAVRMEMQSHLSTLAEASLNSVNVGISQLRAEMVELQANLRAIAAQPQVDLSPLQEQISYLNQQIQNLPLPFDPAPLEQEIDELRVALTQMEEEAERSPLKQDLTVFFSAMKNLYQQQAQNGHKQPIE